MPLIPRHLRETDPSDERIIQILKRLQKDYEKGTKSALIEALLQCAISQAVIPEWAVNALLDAEKGLDSGERKDFNDAFGWEDCEIEPKHQGTRKSEHKREENRQKIYDGYTRYRNNGGSNNSQDLVESISLATGVPERQVKKTIKELFTGKKRIPRGGATNGFTVIKAISERETVLRKGRPILRDAQHKED